MAALRSVATESPSGRLVIDISRLRETLATNPDSEVTVVSSDVAATGKGMAGHNSVKEPAATREPFPRISLSLSGSDRAKKRFKIVAIIVAAVLLIGIALAIRSQLSPPVQPVVVVPSPSPTPTAEPTPEPLPSPSPKREAAKPSPTPEKKKGSRLGRLLKKLIPGKN
jgi:hypothetical protein